MDEFVVIKVMNEAMIKLLKSKNENCNTNLKIKEFLQDEAFFFKINKNNAYKILLSVGVKKEQLEQTYQKLISPIVYYNLIKKGTISATDKLVIKYN